MVPFSLRNYPEGENIQGKQTPGLLSSHPYLAASPHFPEGGYLIGVHAVVLSFKF